MPQFDMQQMQQGSAQAAALLKSLAHPQRLMLLCTLQQQEYSVSQLNELFPMPQSSLSQQLGVLRRQGLVETRRDAQQIFYRLASPEVERILGLLYEMFCQNNNE